MLKRSSRCHLNILHSVLPPRLRANVPVMPHCKLALWVLMSAGMLASNSGQPDRNMQRHRVRSALNLFLHLAAWLPQKQTFSQHQPKTLCALKGTTMSMLAVPRPSCPSWRRAWDGICPCLIKGPEPARVLL